MAAGDLTTLANVKSWLGITNTSDDALLAQLITGYSQFVTEYCSRDFVQTTYTDQIYDGSGSSVLVLRQYPILSISAISIDGVAVPSTSFSHNGRAVLLKTGQVFTSSYGNVSVSYQAGYSTIPTGLERAVIELIGQRYTEKDRIGHASKQLAGETVSFITAAMLNSVREALEMYINRVPS